MEQKIEQLLNIAKKEFDQVSIKKVDTKNISVSFEDSKFKKVESSIRDTTTLSIIKDNYFGFSYTNGEIQINKLIQSAKDSLIGKVDGSFGFAEKDNIQNIDTYKKSIEKITAQDILQNLNKSLDYLKNNTKAQINLEGFLDVNTINLVNSNGVDYNQTISTYGAYYSLIYPGSYSNVSRIIASYELFDLDKENLDLLIYFYNNSEKQVRPGSGKMKVLFLPEAFYTFIYRLSSGLAGSSLFYKKTPLEGKLGEKISSHHFSLYDDPQNTQFIMARSFDDEGTKTEKVYFIEKGVLKNFFFDRKMAKKCNKKSTGHGYSQEFNQAPNDRVPRFIVEKGNSSIYELISMMDKGVIVPSVLGAHSGNIQNGDFSVGLSPGIYVENGQIIGHVKDAMASANIYDCLNSIVAIEDKQHFSIMGCFPAILFDNINVVIK